MNARYFLRGSWSQEWSEVTKEEYVKAERGAGFRPKGFDMGQAATAGFGSSSGVHGKVEYEWVADEEE